jgi:putative NADH-flavin reductase
VGGDELLTDDEGRSGISMEDFAIAMLDEATDPQHPRTRFTVAR